jgi:hypothetical protein
MSSRPRFNSRRCARSAEAELCYAPQFGAAKDPVNLPGCWPKTCWWRRVADWLALDRTDALLVDVREADEFAGGHIPNAINLPLADARPLRRAADESEI